MSDTRAKSGASLALIIVGAVVLIVVIALVAFGIVGFVAFRRFVEASQASEATHQLSALYQSAAAYYGVERWGQRPLALDQAPGATTYCTVDPDRTGNVPGPAAVTLGPLPASFEALEWQPTEPVRFRYAIEGPPGRCANAPDAVLYTLRADGDLDGDGRSSEHWLIVRSDAVNALERGPLESRDPHE